MPTLNSPYAVLALLILVLLVLRSINDSRTEVTRVNYDKRGQLLIV